MTDFARNLKQARLDAGLTQEQLAEQLHVTRQSVSSWELGRTEPDFETAGKLAEIFGTRVSCLLGEEDKTPYPRFQKRFVLGFAACAGLLLAVSGLEPGLFAYWRKLARQEYAAIWKLSVPPLLWYLAGLGAVCFFAWWAPVRCGKRARLAFFTGALLLGLPVLILVTQYLAVALGNFTDARVWLAPFLRYPAGRAAIQTVLPALSGICTGLFACAERRM